MTYACKLVSGMSTHTSVILEVRSVVISDRGRGPAVSRSHTLFEGKRRFSTAGQKLLEMTCKFDYRVSLVTHVYLLQLRRARQVTDRVLNNQNV